LNITRGPNKLFNLGIKWINNKYIQSLAFSCEDRLFERPRKRSLTIRLITFSYSRARQNKYGECSYLSIWNINPPNSNKWLKPELLFLIGWKSCWLRIFVEHHYMVHICKTLCIVKKPSIKNIMFRLLAQSLNVRCSGAYLIRYKLYLSCNTYT